MASATSANPRYRDLDRGTSAGEDDRKGDVAKSRESDLA